MRIENIARWPAILPAAFVLALLGPARVLAHCDGMDGPVVKAAQRALETGNVNLVLIWVQNKDEAEIRKAFAQTLAVRKLGPETKELADRYFFETLVRVHRAGEGAPYTGLKPAGRDLGPAIPAADQAIETGSSEALLKLLANSMRDGVQTRFQHLMAAKGFGKDEVEAGREYVRAYVEFVHYAEGIRQAVEGPAHGHFQESAESGIHKEGH